MGRTEHHLGLTLAQDPWMEPGISGCLVLAQDPWAELSINVYLPKDPFAELSINGRFVLVREPWAQQTISGCFPSRLLGRNKYQSVLGVPRDLEDEQSDGAIELSIHTFFVSCVLRISSGFLNRIKQQWTASSFFVLHSTFFALYSSFCSVHHSFLDVGMGVRVSSQWNLPGCCLESRLHGRLPSWRKHWVEIQDRADRSLGPRASTGRGSCTRRHQSRA